MGCRPLRGAFLEDLTWLEAKAWFDRDPVIVIGIGALAKEHGHHLPLNTDFRVARALLEGVGRALPVLLAPILAFGYYPAFRHYPGSQHLEAETFIAVLREILGGLHPPRRPPAGHRQYGGLDRERRFAYWSATCSRRTASGLPSATSPVSATKRITSSSRSLAATRTNMRAR